MERKDAVPNEVTRKEGTWEKEGGMERRDCHREI